VNRTISKGLRRWRAPLLALAGAGAGLLYGALGAQLTFGPPMVVLGLGGMTLVLAAFALYRVVDPLLGTRTERAAAPQTPVRIRELERDKQAVLKAIREIEFDYQMRKISEPDYKELVQRYRTRAMRIIRELDVGDNYRQLIEEELKTRLAAMASSERPPVAAAAEVVAPAPARPATMVCEACQTVNDADALFCKKCGKKCGTKTGAA
jgi:hypothetical protein